MPNNISFVSGNIEKWREMKEIIDRYAFNKEPFISMYDCDKIEIQGTSTEIVVDKCKKAYNIIKSPVLVEDTSLYFNSLNGLPGPYIKCFHKSLGLDGLVKILSDFQDKSAIAVCMYAYLADENTEPIVFTGYLDGEIVKSTATNNTSFGWDSIFKPHGYDKTFDEMSYYQKDLISHRGIAFKKFLEYIYNINIIES